MARLIAGVALIAFGFVLLTLVGWSTFHPPAHYAIAVRPAPLETQRDAETLGLTPVALTEFLIEAKDMHDPVARGLVARDGERLVPLIWRNTVTSPVLFADRNAADLAKVITALRDHAPPDAVIFAWWDLSRAIRLLARRDAPLDDGNARGLSLPAAWPEAHAAETGRWGAGVPATAAVDFGRFIDALFDRTTDGAATLRRLANGKTAFVVVHISDVGKLAASKAGRLSIGYRDFPASGVSHGVIKSAKQWLQEEHINGPFAAEPVDGALRVHFFGKAEDGERLLAKLLPFSTSNPTSVSGFELVFQHKGYWIYRLVTGD